MSLRIGLDLDNTIINYDRAFLVAAQERGLVPAGFSGTKQQIRDHIRVLPGQDGEIAWQKLQGHVYGKGIMQAELFVGVTEFLARAKAQNAYVTIVSHKTQFGHFDPDKVDLRQAAMAFLETQGVLSFLPRELVFFCATREEKIKKITTLLCDAFVDDLEEVFDDAQFPATVRKLLFSAVAQDTPHRFDVCRDWAEIARSIFADDRTVIASTILGCQVSSVTLAGGGGNSRIYRVIANDKSYALKMYPAPGTDTRDRLGVEKKTLQFFEQHGVNSVPRWLGDAPGYGMLSWAEGGFANPPTFHEIERAAAFIETIKCLSALPDAQAFPPASEACLSAQEIIHQIEHRLSRLQKVAATERALATFLTHVFMPAFDDACNTAQAEYDTHHMAWDAPLTEGKCLIPADFGFHNVIRTPPGALVFIDFEYFGWDDPVKLVADFLLHPAMTLDFKGRTCFATRMREIFGGDPCFAHRLHALTPLFALRWALILLNEFLPERWSGRAFARGENEWATAKQRQLVKADVMVKKRNSIYETPDA